MPRFSCPYCRNIFEASAEQAGTTVRCPSCQGSVELPPARSSASGIAPPRPHAGPGAPSGYGDEGDDRPLREDRPGERRRRRHRQGGDVALNLVRRVSTPSLLILSLLMLPLPFLEVQCVGPTTLTLFRQSGIQAMYGGYSKDSSFERAMQQEMQKFGGKVNPVGGKQGQDEPQLDVSPAPLLIVIVLLVVATAVAGLAQSPGVARTGFVAGLSLFTLVLLITQMVIGFPLERAMNDWIEREQAAGGRNMGGGPDLNNPFGPKLGAAGVASMFPTRYTPWFWIWLVLIVLAFFTTVVEAICMMAYGMQLRPRREPGFD